MGHLPPIRRQELLFVGVVATLYLVPRLILELDRFDSTIGLGATGNGIPAGTFWHYLDGYDHTLNNNVPLIAGACLLIGAWYTFHYLAYPLINDRPANRKGDAYLALTVLLLLGSSFVYYYLKQYIRHQHNSAGSIIGLTVFSRFSKRTVLADAIGLVILLGLYELAFQYYQYLSSRIATESRWIFRLVSYLILGGISLLTLHFALISPSPSLWQGGFRDTLLVTGLILEMMLLQAFVYNYLFPLLKTGPTLERVLVTRVTILLLLLITITTIVWGASTGFYYSSFMRGPLIPFSFMVLLGAIAIAYGRRAFAKEKKELQTQVTTGAAELAGLRAQINPHFLFNALNSLYATALKENSEKTADGIQKLGDMMRFMLEENNRDRIPLNKEIDYLRNYIQLQRMRIAESPDIEIRVTIQESNRLIYLAPMLLTPFVENAFKHGISLRSPSWIYITLTLDESRLYFKVHNSRHSKLAEDPEAAQSGIGLDNVRKRLDLIYPGRHQLLMQHSEQDYFVSLSLVYWENLT